MRLIAILACGALAACTSGDIIVPSEPVIQQVPFQGTPATPAGGDDFVSTIENSLETPGVVNPGAPPVNAAGTPLDADTLNLTLYTIEQQKIDARIAEQELLAARSQLVIVQPTGVPQANPTVNIALFAQQTTNAVGERVHERSRTASLGSGGCSRFRSADDAQRAFLANGGPDRDSANLDPDGDGFACGWDPTPYRLLRS